MIKVDGRILLRDQRSLTPQEFERARRTCESVRMLVASRDAYVTQNKLDPQIAYPGNNWDKDADQPFLNRYRKIAAADYDTINRLRIFAQFSSYDLATQSIVTSGRDVPSVTSDFDRRMEELAPVPDDWIRRFIAITEHLPSHVIPAYPKVLGEIGWNVGGRPVNHDVYAYQERLNLMYEAGIIDWLRKRVSAGETLNILEIGGGYGGLAHALTDVLPDGINYFICDLPESILSSSLYLGIAHPEYEHRIYDGKEAAVLRPREGGRSFTFIPNYMFDDFVNKGAEVALAINTLSFPEMAEAQIRYYAKCLQRLLGSKGVLFEQNEDGRWMGLLDCKSILSESLPFRYTVKPRTIPVLSKGKPDIWGNRDISEIISPTLRPFRSLSERISLSVWKWSQLMRVPGWAMIHMRQILQENVSPQNYSRIKTVWNKLGGRMSS